MKRFEENMIKLEDSTDLMCSNAFEMLMLAEDIFHSKEQSSKIEELMVKAVDLDKLIEEDCIRILMLFQPTAVDIRKIATIMKIITYVERISKYSLNITKVVSGSSIGENRKHMECIQNMFDVTKDMLKIVITGFRENNIYRFDELKMLDDKLDYHRARILDKCLEYMVSDSELVNVSMDTISISRYLERIGDHTCKMGEKVTFMVSGKHIEIDSV